MYQNKRITAALVVAALTFAACDRGPTDATPTAPSSPELATNVSTVCKSASVPTGYVILSYFNSISCGSFGTYPNAKSIGLPASPESVCDTSPIPSGWIITAMGRRYDCDAYSVSPAYYLNTNSIELATDAYEYVCNSSPIPSTYTTTTYTYWTSSCDRYGSGYTGGANARQIRKL